MMFKKLEGNGKLFLFFAVILILGMFVSAFLLYEHFAPKESAFCKFGESFDCGVVNKSPYANLDGISYLLTIDFKIPLPLINISGINPILNFLTANAFLGFMTLAFMFLLVWKKYKKSHFLNIKREVRLLRYLSTFGLVYAVYLIYIQHSLLKTYCIYCLSLDAILLTLAAMFWLIKE